MTLRDGFAQLIMLTAFVMTRGALAADWSQTLEAAGTAAYDTNPQLIPRASVVDEAAQLTMDGTTTAETERDQFTMTPRFSIIRYAHQFGLDGETGSLDLSLVEKSERGQWTFTGQSLTDLTVTSELGTTGINDIVRRRYVNTASVAYQYLVTERLAWQLQGAWQDTRYSDAQKFGLTDFQYTSALLGPIWNFSERIQGSVTVEADRLEPLVGTIENDYSATLQLKRNFSEQYSWRLSAGATRVEAGDYGSGTTSVFEIGATRQGELVQWDASFKQAVLPIGLGFLARQEIAALSLVANTSERSTVSLSFNMIRSDPVTESLYLLPGFSVSFQIYSGAAWGQATAGWNYQLTPHWTASLAYQRARARNYSIPDWANGNQARLYVAWQSGRL